MRPVRNISPIAVRKMQTPAVPVSKSFLRPKLSIMVIAISVKIRFVNPMVTDCMPAEYLLAPAAAKMSFR